MPVDEEKYKLQILGTLGMITVRLVSNGSKSSNNTQGPLQIKYSSITRSNVLTVTKLSSFSLRCALESLRG